MASAAQSQKKSSTSAGSTQKFTEIQDIAEDIVLFIGGSACLIIEVQASNFALLSQQEQNAKIIAYANLINSLSFPIQILIRNKAVDITSYLKLLDDEAKKHVSPMTLGVQTTPISKLANSVALYRDFIQQLVSVQTVLDKKFYIIIAYSYLEKGIQGATGMVQKGSGANSFSLAAKATLHTKADSLNAQLSRLSLRSQILGKEELVKLFYDIYNPSIEGQNTPVQVESIKAPFITSQHP